MAAGACRRDGRGLGSELERESLVRLLGLRGSRKHEITKGWEISAMSDRLGRREFLQAAAAGGAAVSSASRCSPGGAASPRGAHRDAAADADASGISRSGSPGCIKYESFLNKNDLAGDMYDFASKGVIAGAVHLSIGQEAVAVGTCTALRRDDYVTSSHRGHGHAIAKGAALGPMMAELMGRKTGYSKGCGGLDAHLLPRSWGCWAATASSAPRSHWRWARRSPPSIAAPTRWPWPSSATGPATRGTFHEALNIAALWDLPMLFACENNLYAATTPGRHRPGAAQRGRSRRGLRRARPGGRRPGRAGGARGRRGGGGAGTGRRRSDASGIQNLSLHQPCRGRAGPARKSRGAEEMARSAIRSRCSKRSSATTA